MSDGPEQAVLGTDLPGAISRRQGKVRDVYEYEEGMLLVATDRISAFDCVMPNGIPEKGKVLTQLSLFWFDKLAEVAPNHLLSAETAEFPAAVAEYAGLLEGRSVWVKKAEVVPIECVARGYLSGSAWKSYQECGEVCGHALPAGLVESQQLPETIFTPATKAESGHDENISIEQCVELVGADMAARLEGLTLELYGAAAEYVSERGLILCDTKFEFGLADDELIVIDEMLTPDSSRYWDAEKYAPGKPQESYDKQFVRDYLNTLDWDKEPPAPALPAEIVAEPRRIYRTIYRRITGAEVG